MGRTLSQNRAGVSTPEFQEKGMMKLRAAGLNGRRLFPALGKPLA